MQSINSTPLPSTLRNRNTWRALPEDRLQSCVDVEADWYGSVKNRVHLHILVEKLFMEVASDGVVDVSLLLNRRRSRLILEDSVIVPFPLQRQISSGRRQQRVALVDLLTLRSIVLLRLLRL